jgi:hypothetical protein
MIEFKDVSDIELPFGTNFTIALASDFDVVSVDGVDFNLTLDQCMPYIEELDGIASDDGFDSFNDIIVEIPAAISNIASLYDYLD